MDILIMGLLRMVSLASSSVPISKESIQSELTRMIDNKDAPKDFYKTHSFCQPLSLAEGYEHRDAFDDLVEHFFIASKGNAKKLDQYRRHVELILLNLSQSAIKRNWLLLSGNPADFKAGRLLTICGINSFDHAHQFLGFLRSTGLLKFKQGKAYASGHTQNRYWPTTELAKTLAPFGLYAEAQFRPPYVRINSPDQVYEGFRYSMDHDDVASLIELNEFAKDHRWACKAPIVQVFKENPFYSGRLITPFQNLPTREFDIRKQTLIDGEELIETDLNANHLRLFLATHQEPCPEDDPYLEIAEISNTTRDEVKGFINVGLNSNTFQQAQGAALGEWNVSCKASQAIYRAFKIRYPKLKLLCGFGTYAMAHEGMILRNVLLQGLRDGVFALPIHDAIATKRSQKHWAMETMLREWHQWVKQLDPMAKTVVKQS